MVIGLQSTGEARTLEQLEDSGGVLDDFVSTVKYVMLQYCHDFKRQFNISKKTKYPWKVLSTRENIFSLYVFAGVFSKLW